jgi:hypothetical protein
VILMCGVLCVKKVMICYFCVRGKGSSVIHKVFYFFRHMNTCGKVATMERGKMENSRIKVEEIDENLTFVVVFVTKMFV